MTHQTKQHIERQIPFVEEQITSLTSELGFTANESEKTRIKARIGVLKTDLESMRAAVAKAPVAAAVPAAEAAPPKKKSAPPS